MATGEEYEVIEVPVQKVEVKLTLDDLLTALTQHASSLATDTEHTSPETAAQLNQLSQLASQIKSKIS